MLGVHPTTQIIMTAELNTSSPSCMNTDDMTFLELQFWMVKNVLEYSFSSAVSFGEGFFCFLILRSSPLNVDQ